MDEYHILQNISSKFTWTQYAQGNVIADEEYYYKIAFVVLLWLFKCRKEFQYYNKYKIVFFSPVPGFAISILL